MKESDILIQKENEKRKELSRVRIFWLLVVLDILFVAWLIVQIVMITSN